MSKFVQLSKKHVLGCLCEECTNFDDPSQAGTPTQQTNLDHPASSTSSSSMPHVSVMASGLDYSKLESLSLIPITKPSPQMLWRMQAASAGSFRSGGSKHDKHRKSLEVNRAYSVGTNVPGIARHVSGKQSITIQTSQQDTDAVNTSTTVPTYLGQYFTLAQNCPNYSAYTALFDEYKIDLVEAWVTLPTLAAGASTVRGEYSTAVDYDDANTPTTVATVSDKQNSLTTVIDQAHYHKFVPRFAVASYSGSFASYTSDTGWIDCASPNVQHYGLKLAFSATGQGILFTQIVYRLTISFRSPGIS